MRILPSEDGSCAVDLSGLEEHFGLEAGELVAEASWQRRGGYFISSAAASHEGALRRSSGLGMGEAPLEKGVVRPTARGGVAA